jgi:hypothetical protein
MLFVLHADTAGFKPLETSLRKFLFLLVEDRMSRGPGDEILPKWKNHKNVPVLRSLGYIEGNRLTGSAFSAYFHTFSRIDCPVEIQECMADLGITGIQWRHAKGPVLQTIRQAHGQGMSVPALKFVFIRDGAALPTWYHELGHILFYEITDDREQIERFVALAEKHYPVKSSAEIKDAPGIADGSYILIDGRYLGLDHSGTDAVKDEYWAALFERYRCGSTLPTDLLLVLEESIARIKAKHTTS